MNRSLASVIFLGAFAATAAYAKPIHQCVGTKGESMYSDVPCAPVANPEPERKARMDTARLDQIKAEIDVLRRKLHDLGRTEEFALEEARAEERASVVASYASQRSELKSRLAVLHDRQAKAMAEAFSSYQASSN